MKSKSASIHERWKLQSDIFIGTKEEHDKYKAEQRELHFASLPDEYLRHIKKKADGTYKLVGDAPENVAYAYKTYFENRGD